MSMQHRFAAGAAMAISIAGVAVLSGCEERPYPSPTHGEAPAAPPPADLMGAPDHGLPYTTPPVVDAPAYQPPAAVYAAPPAYDGGSVIAMAPIPNPGDPGSEGYYGGYRGRHHHAYAAESIGPIAENTVRSPYGEGHPAPGRHPTYSYSAPAPVYDRPAPALTPKAAHGPVSAKATVSTVTKTTKTITTITRPKLPPVVALDSKSIVHKSVSVAAAAGAAAGAVAHDAKQATTAAVQSYKAPPGIGPAAPVGDRTSRLAALQTMLTDAVGKSAMLSAPGSFTANQPADVSLTLPADFADTLKGEAQKDGLGDAAASVNMNAILSGDGFAVTPDDTQSAPLTVGQPTQFHWTVTAQPGAKGPLHADVGADLLGGGSDKLALGSVQKSAGMGVKLTPRVIGASLLVLIAALVVAWLARGRGPTRSAAARRASRRAVRGGRPLDMSAEGPSTT